MTKSPQAGRTGKALALLATLTMMMAAFVGIGFAPAASAASPNVCPAGYTYNESTKLCDGTESTPAVPSPTPDGYVCLSGWSGPTEDNTCVKAVEPTKEYSCPQGWSGPTEENTCTKDEGWEYDDGEWECEATDEEVQSQTMPSEPCIKTEPAEFDWVCETIVVDSTPTLTKSGGHKSRETHHRGTDATWQEGEKEKCGEHNNPQKPTCPPLVIPATPVYPYICPQPYASDDKPITNETVCSKPVTAEPTCPRGQTLVNGDCQTPSTPVDPDNPNPSEPQPPVLEPIVAAAVTEAPGEVPAEVALSNPAAATVAKPAKAPAKAGVPQAATIPTAVPAGDGASQPPRPLWGVLLAAMVAMTAMGAAVRLMGASNE